jgi:hypothetical protein
MIASATTASQTQKISLDESSATHNLVASTARGMPFVANLLPVLSVKD